MKYLFPTLERVKKVDISTIFSLYHRIIKKYLCF